MMESEPVVYFTNMTQYLNTKMLETIQGSGKGKTFKLGTSGLQVQRSNNSVTVSPSNRLPQTAEQVRLERFNSTEGKY